MQAVFAVVDRRVPNDSGDRKFRRQNEPRGVFQGGWQFQQEGTWF